MKRPTVKIVAIAANEAYFIPEWVYHHLYFGFNKIEIIVNNSSDNTIEILDYIKKSVPNLSYYNYDWFNWMHGAYKNAPSLQECAYIGAYYRDNGESDYILFIDLDEYWFPENCKDSIQDCIIGLGYPDAVAFQWVCIGGRSGLEPHPIIGGENRGFVSPVIKTLLKTGLNPHRITAHYPYSLDISNFVDTNGAILQTNRQKTYTLREYPADFPLKYFILHDYCRFIQSFLSRFARNNVAVPLQSDTRKFIFNRGIYWNSSNSSPLIIYGVPTTNREKLYKNNLDFEYNQTMIILAEDCDLAMLRRYALDFIYAAALEGLRVIEEYARKRHSPAIDILADLGPIAEKKADLIERLCKSLNFTLTSKITGIPDPKSLISSNKITTVKNLIAAMRIWPFALDSNQRPLFMDFLFQFLIDLNLLHQAIQLINYYRFTIPTQKAYYIEAIANKLKETGRLNDASDLFIKLYHVDGYKFPYANQ